VIRSLVNVVSDIVKVMKDKIFILVNYRFTIKTSFVKQCVHDKYWRIFY